MSKVLVNETSLSGIANSIRAKNGTATTYKPSEMAAAIDAIQTGSDIPEEAFAISGDCSYRFARGGWDWFIEQYGDRITTDGITDAMNMFGNSKIELIPFEINFNTKSAYHSTNNMFYYCSNLKEVQKIKNLKVYNTSYFFYYCYDLRNIPEGFASTWDWSYLESQTGSYTGYQNQMFNYCSSLRIIPMDLIRSGNPNLNYGYSYFNSGFCNCYVLDELTNLPIPYTKATWTGNAFGNTFDNCNRLKNITFALQDDGTPYTVSWKNQTIDLSKYVGYTNSPYNILNHNSGITSDKAVNSDESYQALKNDPDWYAVGDVYGLPYSRYNHDSAVATINSLPDTSAYLATAGGTNMIKFKGEAGSATDGGAISSLTPEEIAVAAAKGWTVALA